MLALAVTDTMTGIRVTGAPHPSRSESGKKYPSLSGTSESRYLGDVGRVKPALRGPRRRCSCGGLPLRPPPRHPSQALRHRACWAVTAPTATHRPTGPHTPTGSGVSVYRARSEPRRRRLTQAVTAGRPSQGRGVTAGGNVTSGAGERPCAPRSDTSTFSVHSSTCPSAPSSPPPPPRRYGPLASFHA